MQLEKKLAKIAKVFFARNAAKNAVIGGCAEAMVGITTHDKKKCTVC